MGPWQLAPFSSSHSSYFCEKSRVGHNCPVITAWDAQRLGRFSERKEEEGKEEGKKGEKEGRRKLWREGGRVEGSRKEGRPRQRSSSTEATVDLGGVVLQALQVSCVVYEAMFPSVHIKTSGNLNLRLPLPSPAGYLGPWHYPCEPG